MQRKGLAEWQPMGHWGKSRERLHQLMETAERRRSNVTHLESTKGITTSESKNKGLITSAS